jgi:hypothetical protein
MAAAVFGVVIPATASATGITASTISSPASGSQFFVDQSQSASTATAFTISGTVTGPGNLDLVCVYGSPGTSVAFKTNLAPGSNGSFSYPVTQQQLFNLFAGDGVRPCVIRAIPTGQTATNYRPGISTTYAGPIVSVSWNQLSGDYDFFATTPGIGSGTSGTLEFASAASCGLDYSWLTTNSGSFPSSNPELDCNGGIYHAYPINNTSTYTPDEIMVDGKAAALSATFGSGGAAQPGFEPGSFSTSFSNGQMTIQDNEPVMLCLSACATTSPTSGFGSAGVELMRTWQTADNGLVALQTDVFKSTDGYAHTVNVLEDQGLYGDSTHGTAVEFPGSSGFKTYAPGDTIAPATGVGEIYIKDDQNVPDSGDPTGTWAQGAIVYTKAPTAPVFITYWTPSGNPQFYMPYTLSVPAGGTAALRFAYVQDFALSDVKTLAQQALSSFDPTVSISSPAAGATLSSPVVTIAGTVTDAAGIQSLVIDGRSVPVSSSGAFSTQTTIPVGTFTITALATDNDGLSTTQTATVTVPKQVTPGLGTKVRRTKAHRYRVGGRLQLPAGVPPQRGCTGTVALTMRHGKRRVTSARAKVRPSCVWTATLAPRRLPKGHGKLTITAVFGGNDSILPYTARAIRVH